MTWLSARRRHPLAALLVIALALVAVGAVYTAFTARPSDAAAPKAQASQVEAGRALFLQNCSSCHGLNAQGSSDGPTLIGVGSAAVDFQVGTGRMPLAAPGAQAEAKPPAFTDLQTAQLAAYVATLGAGPAVPTDQQVSAAGVTNQQLVEGGELFRTNCSQCHNFAGEGGALTQGKYAPPLTGASGKVIYEAMLTGPQSMPVFGDGTITPDEKKHIIAFIQQTSKQANPGGSGLGRVGPVAEGAVIWIVGIGLLMIIAVWIAGRVHHD